MGTIFVDNLEPQSGTSLTVGASGDTITLASGAKTSGFGKIGQVVTTDFTGTESTTVKASAGNFTDSSLTATITPTSTSSKLMVMCTVNAGSSSGSNGCHVGRFRQAISGGSTTSVFVGAAAGSRIQQSSGRGNESAGSATILTKAFNFVLSPSTTSATTITYQFATRGGGSGTAYINRTGTDTDGNEDARTASALTVMEILD
jgi:hypothetical protein